MSGNVIVCSKLEMRTVSCRLRGAKGLVGDDVAMYGVLRLKVKSIISNLSDKNIVRE